MSQVLNIVLAIAGFLVLGVAGFWVGFVRQPPGRPATGERRRAGARADRQAGAGGGEPGAGEVRGRGQDRVGAGEAEVRDPDRDHAAGAGAAGGEAVRARELSRPAGQRPDPEGGGPDPQGPRHRGPGQDRPGQDGAAGPAHQPGKLEARTDRRPLFRGGAPRVVPESREPGPARGGPDCQGHQGGGAGTGGGRGAGNHHPGDPALRGVTRGRDDGLGRQPAFG